MNISKSNMGDPYILPNPARNGLAAAWLAVVPVVILIAVYMNLPVYLYTLKNGLLPKYFYFAFALMLWPLVVVRMNAFLAYLVSPAALWAMALLALNFVHFMTDTNGSVAIRNLMAFRMQTIGMVVLLGFAFSTLRPAVYERTFVFLALLLPCAVITDFLHPGLLYPVGTVGSVLGRAAGPFINPTIASEALLLVFLLACPLLQKKYRSPLMLLCGLGVLLTFTRAAMIAWVLLYLYLLVRRKLSAISAVAALAIVSLPLLLGGMESYLSHRSDLDASMANIETRLSFFSHTRFDDHSAIERAEVLKGGWDLFVRNPISGAGAGATSMHMTRVWAHPVSTHNELVLLAAEYGIAGVFLWCWLGAILLRGKYFEDQTFQMAMVLLFVVMTFFTHNMFDFPYWLVTFMLLSQHSRGPYMASRLYGRSRLHHRHVV